MHDDHQNEHSALELQLLRLLEAVPGVYEPGAQIDWIRQTDLALDWCGD